MSLSAVAEIYYGLLVREQIAAEARAAAQAIKWLPLPLTSVKVEAQAFDFCSEVTVTQTYTNHTPCLLESEYIFPLDENSAVCGFYADIDGRRIHGLVKEKSEARKEFNRAKQQGKSTMLLEQKQENVFKISIGNLAPNATVAITLTYITTLDLEGKSNRMVIPAVVAPKYEPRSYWGYNGQYSSEGFNGPASVTVTQTQNHAASQLSFFQSMTAQYQGTVAPPVVVAPPVTEVQVKGQRAGPQRFSMKIEVLMPSEILSIQSETHPGQTHVKIDPLVVQPDAQGRLPIPQHAQVLFGLNADGSEPSVYPESLGEKDFVLTITQKNYLEARAVLEVDPATGSQAIQLAFCPATLDLMDASSLQVEILFLIDQSGSMGGSAIDGVKQCLEIFLRSLPVACKFNLISFGDSYKKLFPKSQKYSEESLNKALAYAQAIQADLGGTEIFPPLKDCFESAHSPEYPKQIFLLTDGQVSNTQQLIDLTRQHSMHTRLFTFGLGSSVDRHLVKTLASAGRGECEFVSGSSAAEARQELNNKVMRNLIRAMQPSLTDIKVDWSKVKGLGPYQPSDSAKKSQGFFASLFGSSKDNPNAMIQCPDIITPVFPPAREIVYALGTQAVVAAPQAGGADSIVNLTVSAYSNRPQGGGIQGKIEWQIPLNLSKPQYGSYIHKLAARARIGEIQNWTASHNRFKNQKEEVLKLAIKYQLMSNFTSFIIVDDRKVKKPKTATKPQLANAQVDMFNAFMSSQTQPGKQVNSNGFAFQSIPAQQTQPAPLSAPVPSAPAAPIVASSSSNNECDDCCDSDGDYDECEEAAELGSFVGGPQVQPSSVSPPSSFGGAPPAPCAAPSAAPGGGGSFSFAKQKKSSSSISSSNSISMNLAPQKDEAAPSMKMRTTSSSARKRDDANEAESCKEISSRLSAVKDIMAQNIDKVLERSECLDSLSERCDDLLAPSFAAAPAVSAPVSRSIPASAPTKPSPAKLSASSVSASTSPANQFSQLVSMAAIDGTWNLTQELLTLIQHAVQGSGQSSDIQAAVSKLDLAGLNTLATTLKLTPKAIGTLLALWTLTQCFSSRQGEWGMLAGKSKGQLRGSLGVPVDQIEAITKQIIVV